MNPDARCAWCGDPREPLLAYECEPGERGDTDLCRGCFAEFDTRDIGDGGDQ